MQNSRFKTFVSNNLVTIVMIPSIIGIHYGWSLMQNNDRLVSEKEKIDLPVVTLAKYLWGRVQGIEAADKGTETRVPSVSAATATAAK